MQIFLFFALIIAVLAVFFALQNSDPVTLKFAVWEFNSSLAFVLLLALLAGALISFFFSLPSNLKRRAGPFASSVKNLTRTKPAWRRSRPGWKKPKTK